MTWPDNHYILVIICVMPTAYSSAKVNLHLPLSFGNKSIDSPSTAPVLLYPHAMHHLPALFPVPLFHGHGESLIYSASSLSIDNSWSTRTNSTFIRPQGSVTQRSLCLQTRGRFHVWRHAIAGSGFSLSGGNKPIHRQPRQIAEPLSRRLMSKI